MLWKVKVKLLSPVQLFETPWTVAYYCPPSMGFSRQEYWSGCHFLLQGIFPIQGSNLVSLTVGTCFTIWAIREFLKMLFNSVQFSRSVVSDSLRPHESQHARPPCPSPTPGVHSNSRSLSQWYHPLISYSVVPISSYPKSLPASECFPMSQLFTWDGQSTGV